MLVRTPILLMALQPPEDDNTALVMKKIDELKGVKNHHLIQLKRILLKYKCILSEKPGLIRGYEHEFKVTDQTPYIQKGKPIPNKYQNVV